MLRGTVSLPAGHRQGRARRRVRRGRRGREAEARAPTSSAPTTWSHRVQGGHPRLRRRHRDARPDGPGRQARPRARPPRADAEPEDRHGHHRRGQGRRGVQGRQGRVPHRPVRQRARADRQGELRGREPGENYRAVLDEICGPSPPSAKGRYIKGITTSSTMGPGVKIDPEVKADRLTAASDGARHRGAELTGDRAAGRGVDRRVRTRRARARSGECRDRACGSRGTGAATRRGSCGSCARAAAVHVDVDAAGEQRLDELQREGPAAARWSGSPP